MAKQTEEDYKNGVSLIRRDIQVTGNVVTEEHMNSLFSLCQMAYDGKFRKDGGIKKNPLSYDRDYWLKVSAFCKKYAAEYHKKTLDGRFGEFYDEILRWEAKQWFESYLLYMEKDRQPSKKFYEPRMGSLRQVVMDFQAFADGKFNFYGLSMPPRVGKSTISIFFLSWTMGMNPNKHSAMGGHSSELAKGFFKEMLTLITSPEYHFFDIFGTKIEDKSAESLTINLGEPDRFPTFTARGIDGTWTGAIDISPGGILYVDDLVRDREESLSPVRLEKKYQDYLNVMVDRKNDGAKELMVGTRWNLFDPLGKREEYFDGNPDAFFRKIPALNEKGESNFQYKINGFSTKFYLDMRNTLDKNEWEAKYQQKPFMREGLAFPEDELNYFNGVLPEGEQSITASVDVAWGGGDYLSMPVGVKIGDMLYITDWVYSNADKFTTRPLVVQSLMSNDVSKARVEANVGGTEYADEINKMITENDGHISIITQRADNKKSKSDKIIQYMADIKAHCVFLEKSKQPPMYQKAFDDLTSYTVVGKNPHDDAPDSLSEEYKFAMGNNKAKFQVLQNPFWTV